MRLLSAIALSDVEGVAKIAEFGLVFLLFMIGLELSWERLARMRLLVFGLGLAQVVRLRRGAHRRSACSGLGLGPAPAMLLGAALAMSSTAIVIPVLAERRRLNRAAGRAAFSVLLLQDLMVAPLLFLISFLADPQAQREGLRRCSPFCRRWPRIGALIVVGRLLLRPLFHLVAAAQSTELFMAACLLVVIGAGVASAAAGFSMGLGAFIAGLLLAETEFRREIEVTIEPFKGLLLGLFFVSVGAGLDFGRVLADPGPVLVIAIGADRGEDGHRLPASAAPSGCAAPVAAEAALLLAPGGEFAFILVGAAIASGVLPQRSRRRRHARRDARHVRRCRRWRGSANGSIRAGACRTIEAEYAHLAPEGDIAAGRVVIVGYGRVGALIGDMLSRHDIPFVAVDNDVTLVAAHARRGRRYLLGQLHAARIPDALRRGAGARAGGDGGKSAGGGGDRAPRPCRSAPTDRSSRARATPAHATHLYELGASDAIPETIEASLQLAETVLVDVGVPMGYVIASIHEKRDEYPQAAAADRRGGAPQARRPRLDAAAGAEEAPRPAGAGGGGRGVAARRPFLEFPRRPRAKTPPPRSRSRHRALA